MRLLTRGLTGSASGLITVGLGPVLEVVRIIKAGGRVAKRYALDVFDKFKITAELYAINGRYLVDAIFNTKSYFRPDRKKISINITKISKSKSQKKDIDVAANIKSVRKGWTK